MTAAMIAKQKIMQAYIAESLERPITKITPNVVDYIVRVTGIDGKTVENVLVETYPNGSVGAFMTKYFEMAFKGRDEATEFEKATVELFHDVFGYKAMVIKEKLINPLDKSFPEFDLFSKRFKELIYSKKDATTNLKTKYAIQKLGCYFDKSEIFKEDGSIEHIIPEIAGEYALNIGNLIILETRINNEAGNACYTDKISFYKHSHYLWVNKFVEKNNEWNSKMVEERAKGLALLYYHEILKKDLPLNIDNDINSVL